MNWKPEMSDVISNTSPLLYLYRIKADNWLPELFDEVWTPDAVWGKGGLIHPYIFRANIRVR